PCGAVLERFGYVEVEAEAIRVTPQGDRAARGDADVSGDVSNHFKQVIESGAEPETFDGLLEGLGDTQPQIESPLIKPVEGHLGQGPLSHVRAARLGELGLMVALKEYKPLWESLPWLSRAEL